MILPSKFYCPKCNQDHILETLLEFPLPDSISAITSGKVKGDITNLSKNIYRVNAELYMYVSLKIKIKDFYDQFEIQNWIKVDSQECERVGKLAKKIAAEDSYESSLISITGKMVYPMPIYGMSDYPIVKVSYPPTDLLPDVELVNSTSKMYDDWKNGISLNKLEEYNSLLYHV